MGQHMDNTKGKLLKLSLPIGLASVLLRGPLLQSYQDPSGLAVSRLEVFQKITSTRRAQR
jgi:hypothetical protein